MATAVRRRRGARSSAPGMAQEARVVVQRQNQPVDLEQHLARRRCRRAGGLRRRRRGSRARAPAARCRTIVDQRVAHRPGPVVELDRAADVDAARVDLDRHPPQPALEQRAQPRQAARRAHRRAEHLFLELGVVLADDRDLQLLARAEMGEHARLAHPGHLGQRADRQAFEARCARPAPSAASRIAARVCWPFMQRLGRCGVGRRRRRCRRRENPRRRADAAIGQKRTIVLFCRKTAGRAWPFVKEIAVDDPNS